jgi:hypothetical protein
MPNCDPKLTADMLYDCADKPKKGLDGGRAVIINYDDIDRAGSTVDGAKITDLVLKAGTTGFAAEWFKDLASANSAFAPSTEDVDGFLQNFLTRIQNASAGGAERAAELSQGRFVFACETRYKGAANVEAFKVFGWENGLKLSEMTYDTLANSGSLLYTVASEEGSTETYPFNVFLEADYATSKATFDTLFATV